ncbi:hypothetical protein COLO4_20370 [Corchorus olitorius]|uniref:Uncharacterized protein n=1 Tax=Corchorus olitorius TaxID=93759 RepID=A0A1R3J059_9ROSI|nr:hypothetical protein COLO4_20370 [Corchorus olitorius]
MKSTCNDLELGAKYQLIQFASLEPVLVQFPKENPVACLVTKGEFDAGNEAWTHHHQPKMSTVEGRYQGKDLLSPTKKGYKEHSLEVSNNETSEQSFKLSEDEKPRVSAFDRLGMTQTHKFVFDRLNVHSSRQKEVVQAGGSVFDKLSSSKDSTTKTLFEHEWRDDKETYSRIPSRMKRHLLLEIDTNGPLKVKRRVVVCTSSSVQGKLIGKLSEHVYQSEPSQVEAEKDLTAFEDRGQASVVSCLEKKCSR